MQIDPADIPLPEFYRHMTHLITPRPIAWVSTVDAQGRVNLAPFSFFNGVGTNPPSVMFSPVRNRQGVKKHTLLNVEQTRQFVVNIVSGKTVEVMNQTSADYDYGVSELEAAGLTPVPSQRVSPPRVAEASASLECEVFQLVPVGDGPLSATVVIGRVLLVHVSEEVLNADHQIDPEKLDTVGRMGGALYTRTRDLFELQRPTTPGASPALASSIANKH